MPIFTTSYEMNGQFNKGSICKLVSIKLMHMEGVFFQKNKQDIPPIQI